jgi:2,5-furandicarboxylate decarboxylase 1
LTEKKLLKEKAHGLGGETMAAWTAMETLRDYLSFMQDRGLLLIVKEEVEPADIPRLIELLSDRGKAVHFARVKGYGCGVVANLVPSLDALAAVIGTDDPYGRFLKGVKETEKKVPVARQGLETVDTTNGDLLSLLPILKHCEKDSAPFITTGIASAIDPDSGIAGRGIHRMEYRGGNRLGVALLTPPLSEVIEKYRARGERMRLAVAIGVDPLLFLSMALKGADPGTDKIEVAGGLKGHGIKTIESLDSGVDMPAGAEYYLEGYVDCADVRQDGPLGEIGGYYMTLRETPTFVVNTVSHRPSPLYHALLPISVEGDAYLTFVSRAHIEEGIKRLFPFIRDIVFVPKTFGSSAVVSIRPAERAKVRNLIVSMMGFPTIKKVVVVDEDVDPRNMSDVEWAVVTRCVAESDVIIVPNMQGQAIDPQAKRGVGVAKMGIDATAQGKEIDEKARAAEGNKERIEKVMKAIGGAGYALSV